MSSQSVLILTNQDMISYSGEKFRIYDHQNLLSVSWTLIDFAGRIYIECSLADDPTEDDWFSIEISPRFEDVENPINMDMDQHEYRQYAKDAGRYELKNAVTESHTFQIKTVWIRARIDRSYEGYIPMDNVNRNNRAPRALPDTLNKGYSTQIHGRIDKVLLNSS